MADFGNYEDYTELLVSDNFSHESLRTAHLYHFKAIFSSSRSRRLYDLHVEGTTGCLQVSLILTKIWCLV